MNLGKIKAQGSNAITNSAAGSELTGKTRCDAAYFLTKVARMTLCLAILALLLCKLARPIRQPMCGCGMVGRHDSLRTV